MGRRPELEPPGRVLARVLEAAFGMPVEELAATLNDVSIESEDVERRVREAWRAGRPALHSVALSFDGAALARRVALVSQAARADGSPAASQFCRAIEHEPERLLDWVQSVLGGAEDFAEGAIRDLGLEVAFVESVLRVVLLSELGDWSQRVCARLGESSWRSGRCPVCGSAPALAESRGLEQVRYLRCVRCGASWPVGRFRCPFCDVSDHRTLRYAFAEGEEDQYRLAICDRCGGRFTIVATIAPLSPPGLLVAELAAIHLDFIAEGRDLSYE
jgi:FdhE protein